MSAKKKKELTPPDLKQCQAEMRSLMTLGPGMNRCQNKPTVIATEAKPGKDGRTGSMSLCDECLLEFVKRMPKGHAVFEKIKEA